MERDRAIHIRTTPTSFERGFPSDSLHDRDDTLQIPRPPGVALRGRDLFVGDDAHGVQDGLLPAARQGREHRPRQRDGVYGKLATDRARDDRLLRHEVGQAGRDGRAVVDGRRGAGQVGQGGDVVRVYGARRRRETFLLGAES